MKSIARKIVVCWCLYGIIKICILLNPLLFRVAAMVKPVFQDNSGWKSLDDVPWNSSNPRQIVLLWVIVWFCLILTTGLSYGLSALVAWLFATDESETEEKVRKEDHKWQKE